MLSSKHLSTVLYNIKDSITNVRYTVLDNIREEIERDWKHALSLVRNFSTMCKMRPPPAFYNFRGNSSSFQTKNTVKLSQSK